MILKPKEFKRGKPDNTQSWIGMNYAKCHAKFKISNEKKLRLKFNLETKFKHSVLINYHVLVVYLSFPEMMSLE